MSPTLTGGEYVYCTFPNAGYGDYAELEPIASCIENEGLTLIIPLHVAHRHDLDCTSVFRKITLEVHSSLDAVGLTAAFSNILTEHGISANVVAGYFHDHIFVQSEKAHKAVEVLKELSDS